MAVADPGRHARTQVSSKQNKVRNNNKYHGVRMRRMRIILSNHVRRQLNSVSLKVDEQRGTSLIKSYEDRRFTPALVVCGVRWYSLSCFMEDRVRRRSVRTAARKVSDFGKFHTEGWSVMNNLTDPEQVTETDINSTTQAVDIDSQEVYSTPEANLANMADLTRGDEGEGQGAVGGLSVNNAGETEVIRSRSNSPGLKQCLWAPVLKVPSATLIWGERGTQITK